MRRVVNILALVLTVASAMAMVRPARAGVTPDPTCFGLPATIYQEGGVITGTGGGDVIVGLNVEAVIAYGGDDTICVGQEIPVIRRGADIDAGSGADRVNGCDGNALPVPGASRCAREIRGGSGDDRVLIFAEVVYGGSGNDWIDAFNEAYGESGNDDLAANWLCDGGTGTDVAVVCRFRVVGIP